MSKKQGIKPEKSLLKEVRGILMQAEALLRSLTDQVTGLRDKYEYPFMVEEIKNLISKKKIKNISTSWLQRRYQIGYARAARLMDELKIKRIIRNEFIL